MKRYRAVSGKEAPWQTTAVKSAVQLFRGTFDIEDSGTEPSETEYTDIKISEEETQAAEKGRMEDTARICLPGFGLPVKNPAIKNRALLWKNLRRIQRENGMTESRQTGEDRMDFCMEMPEWEGRSFVLFRTILELNQAYGLLKFIVAVPSVAERLKLAEAARKFSGCFSKLGYPGLSDCSFSCRGENLREVSTRLVESERLSICIMNIQTFNRGTNRLRAADEYGQVLWEDIRAARPVVILDEPGADGGLSDLQESSKAFQALEGLNPLFTLRFQSKAGAVENRIFSLTREAALRQGAVKPCVLKCLESHEGEDGLAGEKIRLAVRLHIEKQLELLRAGRRVKCLTLFFTAASSHERARLLTLFDQAYQEMLEEYDSQIRQLGEEALSVFCREPQKARRVFLGIDKSGRERELDGWEKKDAGSFRKRLLEDVNRGIGEMLRESGTLSSFERQEAFLFAHPALRRGCDNRNLFVICCLDSGVPEASLRKKAACGQWLSEDQEGNHLSWDETERLWVIGEGILEDPYWSRGKETACSEPFQKALESLEKIKREPAFSAPSGLARLTKEERNELLSCMDRAEELLKKAAKPQKSVEEQRKSRGE